MFLAGTTDAAIDFTSNNATIATRNGFLFFESGNKTMYLDMASLSECKEIDEKTTRLATRAGRVIEIHCTSGAESETIINKIDQSLADNDITHAIRPNGKSDILYEINQLIGLDTVKDEVEKVVNLARYQRRIRSQGATITPVSRHMVFTGNPGTGKTTVARTLSGIYKRLGVLSKGHLVEADRAALVGGYLGQTAIKTNELIDKALGGILFIDEAYSLSSNSSSDQFGEEAINTLLKRMEDERDDLIVITAGYKEEMKGFINSNPGLRSRFSKYIQFDDYSAEELAMIFAQLLKKSGHTLSPECKDRLAFIFEAMDAMKDAKFGNGRTVRNLYERVVENLANRLAHANQDDDLFMIVPEDITIDDLNFVMGSTN